MHKHETYGFLRVAAAVPEISVANCKKNAESIIELMRQAQDARVSVLVFPELCLTAYTCADLFQQSRLLKDALEALQTVLEFSGPNKFKGIVFLGLPLAADDQLFNCAAAICNGELLGIVPKSFIPNYKEFYERRWFAPAANSKRDSIQVLGKEVPFGCDLLFSCQDFAQLTIGLEICEDLWTAIPPSSHQALAGANLLLNLSASNELIGKAAYRKELVMNQSARCLAAYVYSSCGAGESSTDLVFSGHAMIAENGIMLAENKRLQQHSELIYADIDIEKLNQERLKTNSFGDNKEKQKAKFRLISFRLGLNKEYSKLARFVDAHPFVPSGKENLSERCGEIFQIQVNALLKRLKQLSSQGTIPKLVIGVSGGLDSTLALLVSAKAMDLLSYPRSRINAITMPGFGTTGRTRKNAGLLMEYLSLSRQEIDIKALCLAEMQALKHSPFGIEIENMELAEFLRRLQDLPDGSQDLVFENVQARMRTSLLMNSGFVIGTGDLSELALGWCTYNADHMSMYNPNVSIPKTLVKFLVDWAADNEFEGDVQSVLKDIVATEISPELLPPSKDGRIAQKTESSVGPYELNDFFLFNMLRYGFSPEKIYYLAKEAKFSRQYNPGELRNWLKLFYKRFFQSQYKRSCLPDGPKVGSVSLSPRGDWRMPSDADYQSWINWLEEQEREDTVEQQGQMPAIKFGV